MAAGRKVTVYFGDEIAARIKANGHLLNVSSICQAAVVAVLDEIDAFREYHEKHKNQD